MMTYISPKPVAMQGLRTCLIMLLPPEMELAQEEDSVSTNLPGLQEEKQLKSAFNLSGSTAATTVMPQ